MNASDFENTPLVFVSRNFTFHDGQNNEKDIELRILKPELTSDGEKYQCGIQILGFSETPPAPKYFFGQDSMQALLLTIMIAKQLLLLSARENEGTLKWLDQEDLALTLD